MLPCCWEFVAGNTANTCRHHARCDMTQCPHMCAAADNTGATVLGATVPSAARFDTQVPEVSFTMHPAVGAPGGPPVQQPSQPRPPGAPLHGFRLSRASPWACDTDLQRADLSC